MVRLLITVNWDTRLFLKCLRQTGLVGKVTFNNGLRKVWKENLVVYCRIGLTLKYFLGGTEKIQVRQ